MASEQEIESYLKSALDEIGEIRPWFNKPLNTWVYYHPYYPVEYSGDTEYDVVHQYPLYLKEFIKHQLDNESNETEQVELPKDIAAWIKKPSVIDNLRQMIKAYQELQG